ncbi:hypothetical protein E2C01_054451 [Portunus trituberculatus]|uniref:Uncharacterized protein n=1 Tax=Portunus trituberculatus TaxID=210409 RepID=A0A5B7GT86_PORTR|nr:hypothetical protein [Portunus trituberculatus]
MKILRVIIEAVLLRKSSSVLLLED